MVVTKNEKIIEAAVEKLNKVNKLDISKISTRDYMQDGNWLGFIVEFQDNKNGRDFAALISFDLFKEELKPDDPANLSPDDIILLRVAKTIYDAYKYYRTTLIDPAVVAINGTAQTSGTITTTDVSINGTSVAETINEVKDLKSKIVDLEAEKNNLESILLYTKAQVDYLLDMCRQKGVID